MNDTKRKQIDEWLINLACAADRVESSSKQLQDQLKPAVRDEALPGSPGNGSVLNNLVPIAEVLRRVCCQLDNIYENQLRTLELLEL